MTSSLTSSTKKKSENRQAMEFPWKTPGWWMTLDENIWTTFSYFHVCSHNIRVADFCARPEVRWTQVEKMKSEFHNRVNPERTIVALETETPDKSSEYWSVSGGVAVMRYNSFHFRRVRYYRKGHDIGHGFVLKANVSRNRKTKILKLREEK